MFHVLRPYEAIRDLRREGYELTSEAALLEQLVSLGRKPFLIADEQFLSEDDLTAIRRNRPLEVFVGFHGSDIDRDETDEMIDLYTEKLVKAAADIKMVGAQPVVVVAYPMDGYSTNIDFRNGTKVVRTNYRTGSVLNQVRDAALASVKATAKAAA